MHRLRDLFSDGAAAYARYRPSYPDEVIAFLRRLAPADGLVWESGCGSGQLTSRLVSGFERIVAADASPAQIGNAHRAPQVRHLVERAEASALADGTADLCIAAQAAHWFDLGHYYAEVRRIGRAGAHIVLLTYGRVEGTPDIDDVIREFATRTLADHWPAERRHVDARYRTLPFPFRDIESPEFALRASWTLDAFLGYISTWSAVHALVQREGSAPLRDFRDRIRNLWGPPARTRAFRWPLTVRAGAIRTE